tara:strand:+ start:412 stop:765 length:354 start_codon:yes stop_codon:yes gene_type:complete
MRPSLYSYEAEVVSVYDGDTYTLNVDLGYGVCAKKVKCRMFDIGCPEIRSKDKDEKARGMAARERVRELLPVGSRVVITSHAKGKYGRWLITLWPDGLDETLSEILLREGHAEVYES